MSTPLDLSEYDPREPDSDGRYALVEEAVILARRGHRAAAIRRAAEAIDAFAAAGDRHGEARARAKGAIVFRFCGDADRSEREARAAIDYFERSPDPHFRATAALELGQVLHARGDYAGAIDVDVREREALGDASATPVLRSLRAFLLANEANARAMSGGLENLEETVRLREQVIPIMVETAARSHVVQEYANLAQDLLRLGRLDDAERALRSAEPYLPEVHDETTLANFAYFAGKVRAEREKRGGGDAAGDAAGDAPPTRREAATLRRVRHELERARVLAERSGMQARALAARLELAAFEIESGDADEAAHLLRRAAARIPAIHLDAPDRRQIQARLDGLRHQLQTRRDDEAGDGGLLGVLPPEILAGIRAGHASITITASPEVPGSEDLEPPPALEEPEDLLPNVWSRVDGERALVEAERRKSADLLRLMQRHHDADGDRAILQALALDGESTAIPVRPMETPALREVFVDYYARAGELLLFVERPGRPVECSRLDVSPADVGGAVAELRRLFDGTDVEPGIFPERPWSVSIDFVSDVGRRLMPFLDDLDEDELLCLFPHGALHNFPFHAVEDRNGRPLIDRVSVAYGFSRRLLAVARAANGARPGEPRIPRSALTVAAPVSTDWRPDLFRGEGDFLRGLGLDVTSLETPQEATAPRVAEAMAAADLVHLTCHGLFSATDPLDSALVLSGGERWATPDDALRADSTVRLSARQLFALRLGADTVVLRACSSGVTNVREGDEQEGLLRALVHAGVSSLVASRWKVDLRSSREILREMYASWIRDRVPKAVALRRAQQALRAHATREHYRHPYHWAPFVLVGDWW